MKAKKIVHQELTPEIQVEELQAKDMQETSGGSLKSIMMGMSIGVGLATLTVLTLGSVGIAAGLGLLASDAALTLAGSGAVIGGTLIAGGGVGAAAGAAVGKIVDKKK